jgi:hypothetical protein
MSRAGGRRLESEQYKDGHSRPESQQHAPTNTRILPRRQPPTPAYRSNFEKQTTTLNGAEFRVVACVRPLRGVACWRPAAPSHVDYIQIKFIAKKHCHFSSQRARELPRKANVLAAVAAAGMTVAAAGFRVSRPGGSERVGLQLAQRQVAHHHNACV